MDAEFIDPFQHYNVNPVEVVTRTQELLDSGEWDNPIKIKDASMDDYDAIVIVGGPGSALDLVGNPNVHELLVEAYKSDKLMGGLCYAVGCFVWARRPEDGKSIMRGKTITAHPAEWDFKDDMDYSLVGATADNPGTDLITPGFAFPLQVIVEDAVGPDGTVIADATANRDGNELEVVVDAVLAGEYVNGERLSARFGGATVQLDQVGPGRYVGRVPWIESAGQEVVVARDGDVVARASVTGPDPEFADIDGARLLEAVAQRTGGAVVAGETYEPELAGGGRSIRFPMRFPRRAACYSCPP